MRKINELPHIETNVLIELEVVRIHPKVLHDEGVVHEVWEVCRDGEVAEAHHLLGGVDDDRMVDAGPFQFWVLLQGPPGGLREGDVEDPQHANTKTYLKPPETPNVIAAFKADRFQPLIQAALNAGQTGAPSSDHSHASTHLLPCGSVRHGPS